MVTTIQVSEELKEVLNGRKLMPGETYEDVIWGILEDTMELSDETKKHIAEAEEDIKAGRTYSLEEVKRRIDVRSRIHRKGNKKP